ncbi:MULTISPECIES: metal/formaldehyde-sensitive transcriptional repressor [Pseudoxanthomonas]|jgi:DNA-binding FrmR family transcriptional regulator|uniref:Metal/formaldehyde-sensitive transcriptional repressor n=1 Tax=Pseudoxanthomonas winnipegensis TaxID=2480810 RepID=A0A4Q8LBV1_9GAMM|nr:metal/formaldehyde-sensitive transcriptional repressor [Pseudoxanthomonas winnipegensis]RZZ83664.1 metal/formaldehyde-sensitive transcriptional repressor [Pseudoxanthomonas winnipegensis]TAA06893.1 metal/formaldehyde-sensitive transcriptional repressor [Pseudoxanthomonas winnipegensis]TAA16806.1 metal/formaldehyde-sensitive transcriptional repressor [Pseudoxanthomonas winnipegensis]TAA26329.1 metal/formaldehyde-sensitive transcriptional repressor [Pseudoxanthomonas winnipegensis]TAA42790.1 
MSHVIHDAPRLTPRVKRLKGQVAALEKALAGEPECLAVLTQIAAIRGAAQSLLLEVLEGHMQSHVAEEKNPAARRAEVAAVNKILRSYLK